MWEYKVVSGTYSVDGANVIVKNQAGEAALQVALDHYGADRWELVTAHLDGVQREVVLVLKRPKGGVAVPVVPVAAAPVAAPAPVRAPTPAPPAGPVFVDPDGEVVRRRAPGSPPAGGARATGRQTGGRRNRADLDKLAGD